MNPRYELHIAHHSEASAIIVKVQEAFDDTPIVRDIVVVGFAVSPIALTDGIDEIVANYEAVASPVVAVYPRSELAEITRLFCDGTLVAVDPAEILTHEEAVLAALPMMVATYGEEMVNVETYTGEHLWHDFIRPILQPRRVWDASLKAYISK